MFEGGDIITTMQEWQRVISHAQAQQLKGVMALAALRRHDGADASDYVADEIALALDISRVAANIRLGLAFELTERLPATLAALERGELDFTRAQAVSDATSSLTAEHAAAVEAAVLQKAKDQNAPQLRRALKRAVLTIDPEGGHARYQQRSRDRHLVVTPDQDGMSWLSAHLPARAATAIYLTVNQAARVAKTPEDGRTADQRRADTFVDLLLGKTTAPAAQVKVVIPAGTLLGVPSGAPAGAPLSTTLGVLDQPGELAGYGPIPAPLAREIAADATWTRLLTDPVSGTLLDCGRTTYKPPAALADFVRARDKTCRFPGCTRSAERCELDHRTQYPNGPTSADNLDALCTHHHQLKHRSNWSGERLPNGDYHWTSPAGHVYTSHAEPVVPIVNLGGTALVTSDDPPPF